MDEANLDLIALGTRIKVERLARGLSQTALAERAGLSRGMVVAVEAGDKAASVVTLHRIATGLGTSMTRLLGEERGERVVVQRAAAQVVVRDPTGWERRHLAPPIPGVDFEFMRTTMPPGGDAGSFPPHAASSREYVAVERGTLRLTINGRAYDLDAGDSIAYRGDCQHAFANPGGEECVYYLALEGGVAATASHLTIPAGAGLAGADDEQA